MSHVLKKEEEALHRSFHGAMASVSNDKATSTYSVRYVHAVSSSSKDVGPDVEINHNAWSNKNTLGKALRKLGILASGASVKHFRVESDKIVVYPSKHGLLGPKPHLMSSWHAVVLTAV